MLAIDSPPKRRLAKAAVVIRVPLNTGMPKQMSGFIETIFGVCSVERI